MTCVLFDPKPQAMAFQTERNNAVACGFGSNESVPYSPDHSLPRISRNCRLSTITRTAAWNR